jgi:hypothetical protein
MDLLSDPEWLAHRYDPAADAVHLKQVPRDVRREKAFLTDEYLGTSDIRIVERAELAAARPGGPAHFIFHSAFCCSTLLAAALDVAGVATSFKEPVILNDIVGWLHRGGDRNAIARRLGDALNLLTPFAPGEAAVIKPSNVVNGLAGPMMQIRPDARAILMFAKLPAYLTSIARKGIWSRVWVRELLIKQMSEGFIPFAFEPEDYLRQTDLQVAAVGWLAQHAMFHNFAARWPDRVRILDGDDLVAAPLPALQSVAAFLGLELSEAQAEEAVSTVFARDSKDGAAFVSGQRESTADAAYQLHRQEIDHVVHWAAEVASVNRLSLEFPDAFRLHHG